MNKKQKIRKSVTKRFRVTKTGKVMRLQGGTGHLNTKKSKKRKRRLKGPVEVKGSYAKRIKKYLGTKKRKKGVKENA